MDENWLRLFATRTLQDTVTGNCVLNKSLAMVDGMIIIKVIDQLLHALTS